MSVLKMVPRKFRRSWKKHKIASKNDMDFCELQPYRGIDLRETTSGFVIFWTFPQAAVTSNLWLWTREKKKENVCDCVTVCERERRENVCDCVTVWLCDCVREKEKEGSPASLSFVWELRRERESVWRVHNLDLSGNNTTMSEWQ